MYVLDNKDIETLTAMTNEKIADARKADDVNDDQLSHLFALRGKLAKIAAGRDDDQASQLPKAKRSPRSKAAKPNGDATDRAEA